MIKDRLARTLRKERFKRRWTPADAAGAYGIPAETYEKLESGSLNATLLTLERLCTTLKIDVRALFEL